MPVGTDIVRFATQVPPTGGVVGLTVSRAGRLVARSSGATPEITLTDPPAGDYHVAVGESDAATASGAGRLLSWVVPHDGGTRVHLSTDAVGFAPGRKFRYSASWTHLDPSKQYLGAVGYGDSERRTVVEVNPGAGGG